MNYEPTVWKDGDLVTSAKLNKLEQGVASAGGASNTLMVEMVKTQDGWAYESVMDADDIGAAFISGKTVIVHFPPWDESNPDAYAQLIYYAPASSDPNSVYTEPCFLFSYTNKSHSSDYYVFTAYSSPFKANNGKLRMGLQD